MAVEPVSIFAARIDPAGVRATLERWASRIAADGGGGDWARADLWLDGLDRMLTVRHDRLAYRGPIWRTELLVLRERIGAAPPAAQRGELIRAAAGLRFVVSLDRTTLVDLDAPGPARDLVVAVATHLDGLIVTRSTIRDPRGRVLAGLDGADPAARVPGGAGTMPSTELVTEWGRTVEEAPDARRVARRALAIAALSSRAFLEQLPPETDAELERVKLHAWVDAVGIDEELEPEEWRDLQTRVHQLDERRAVDDAWRFEGLTVLAWSLGVADVPLDHELMDATELFPRVGFLDLEAATRFVDEATLRPTDEIDALTDRLAVLLEQLRGMRRRKRDLEFTRTARTAYAAHFAAVGLSGGALERSLALPGPGVETSEAEVAQIENIVLERLVAALWLLEGGTYSHVDV